MRFSFLPIIVLMMPILEIAGFIIVGKTIGLWLTLALVLFTSFLGLLILRLGGLGMVRNLQDAGRTGAQPADELVNGAMRVVAGILLFIPGFITDILGLLLLSPAIRRFFWKAFDRASSWLVHSDSPAPGRAIIPVSAMARDLMAIRRSWIWMKRSFTATGRKTLPGRTGRMIATCPSPDAASRHGDDPITKGCKPGVEMIDRLPRIHAARNRNDR